MTPQFRGRVKIFYGPPGTGKTYRLIGELRKLLAAGYLPSEIAYISFTKEGTNQGVRRACEEFGYTRKDVPYFRTWHSVAFHALGLKKDQVISSDHYKMFGDSIGMHFTGYYTEDLHGPDDKYLFFVDLLRNNKSMALTYVEDLDYNLAQYVAESYRTFKDTFELVDFTDMITRYIKECAPLPIRAAILDETQDFTTLQWEMAEIALANCEQIFIAGDDDQAIYQWSGADVEAFMSVDGEKEVLTESYRLPRNILNFAETITDQISKRIEKKYKPKKAAGHVYYISSVDEAPLDLPGRYMFLTRNNKFLGAIEEYLQSEGILYETKKGLAITPIEMGCIDAWQQICTGAEVTHSQELRVKQAVNNDAIFDGRKLPWHVAFTSWEVAHREYILQAMERYGPVMPEQCLVRVSTIHMVKGDEAENVVLFTGMSRPTWEDYQDDADVEHRVFYVGATRASENLFVVFGEERYAYELYLDKLTVEV